MLGKDAFLTKTASMNDRAFIRQTYARRFFERWYKRWSDFEKCVNGGDNREQACADRHTLLFLFSD